MAIITRATNENEEEAGFSFKRLAFKFFKGISADKYRWWSLQRFSLFHTIS